MLTTQRKKRNLTFLVTGNLCVILGFWGALVSETLADIDMSEISIEGQTLQQFKDAGWSGYETATDIKTPSEFKSTLDGLVSTDRVWIENNTNQNSASATYFTYTFDTSKICVVTSASLSIQFYTELATAYFYPCEGGGSNSEYCYLEPPSEVKWSHIEKHQLVIPLKSNKIEISGILLPDGYVIFEEVTITHGGNEGEVCGTTTVATTSTDMTTSDVTEETPDPETTPTEQPPTTTIENTTTDSSTGPTTTEEPEQSESTEIPSTTNNSTPEIITTKASTTDVTTTKASTPEITTPDASTTEITTTEVSTPEITTPDASTTEITTTEVSTPEITTTEASTTEITTEASTPEITTTEVSTPEITTTEVSTPEITTTEVSTPEITTIEASTTEIRTTPTSTTIKPPTIPITNETPTTQSSSSTGSSSSTLHFPSHPPPSTRLTTSTAPTSRDNGGLTFREILLYILLPTTVGVAAFLGTIFYFGFRGDKLTGIWGKGTGGGASKVNDAARDSYHDMNPLSSRNGRPTIAGWNISQPNVSGASSAPIGNAPAISLHPVYATPTSMHNPSNVTGTNKSAYLYPSHSNANAVGRSFSLSIPNDEIDRISGWSSFNSGGDRPLLYTGEYQGEFSKYLPRMRPKFD